MCSDNKLIFYFQPFRNIETLFNKKYCPKIATQTAMCKCSYIIMYVYNEFLQIVIEIKKDTTTKVLLEAPLIINGEVVLTGMEIISRISMMPFQCSMRALNK